MKRKSIQELFFPIFLETMFMMLAGTVDTMMLSTVSNAAVGAVGTANSYINLFIISFGVISSGLTAVSTQYIGARQLRAAGQSLILGLAFNGCIGAGLSCIMFFGSRQILHFAGVAPGLFSHAQIYLRIVGGCCFLNAFISVLSAFLRSFGFTKQSLWSTFASNLVNLILNAVFLFRLHWGVAGVAAATVVSRVVNLAALAWIVRSRIHINDGSKPVAYRSILVQMIRIGLPAALENALYNAAAALTVRFLNQMDDQGINMTARTYCQQLSNFSMAAAAALSQANGIVAGWHMGAMEFDACDRQTKRSGLTAVVMGASIAGVMALSSKVLFRLFTEDTALIALASTLMYINILLEIGRATNLVFGTALKICGDSVYPSVIGAIFMYLLMVGGTWFFGISLNLRAVGAMIGLMLDECVRAMFLYGRWCTGKWRRKGILTAQ